MALIVADASVVVKWLVPERETTPRQTSALHILGIPAQDSRPALPQAWSAFMHQAASRSPWTAWKGAIAVAQGYLFVRNQVSDS